VPAQITSIHLTSGLVSRGGLPELQAGGYPPVRLGPRISGDLAFSAESGLVVPVFYVDNTTPGPQPTLTAGGQISPPTSAPYYTQGQRFGGHVVAFPTDDAGVLGDGEDPLWVGADPVGALAVGSTARDGSSFFAEHVAVVFEGSDAAALLEIDERSPTVVRADLAANPGALVVTDEGETWVFERGTRTAALLPVERMVDSSLDRRSFDVHHSDSRFEAGSSTLDPDIEAGRALFYSSSDPALTFPGFGIACAHCHVDGRVDGLTWPFDEEPRQTPSLVGVRDTAPYTWTGDVPSVISEARLTSIGRMGGTGLEPEQLEQLAKFLVQLREIDTPKRGDTDELVLLGAEIAARPDVDCVGCHSGPRFTDNQLHEFRGLMVNTPSLSGVAATAPYLHDGGAATLRYAIHAMLDSAMAEPVELDEGEVDALEAWLRSL
jgi:hypothetical protein